MHWSLWELEALAEKVLPRPAFDYAAGGAGDEVTLQENVASFRGYRFRPRFLTDVSTRDTSTRILGKRHPVPFGVAPTAFHRLFHHDGEMGVARAAGARGVLHVVSTLSTTPLEDVARAYLEARASAGLEASGGLWFQVYVHRDRALTRKLVERAAAAGYEALVLTVDTPVQGERRRDVRNRFQLPEGMGLANFLAALDAAEEGRDGLSNYIHRQLDDSLTWRDVEWLREVSELPVLVKGVLTAEDALVAVEHGAAGIVVSNHGARQLDRVSCSLDALPEVVAAVAGAVPVLMDGGVRGGADVLVALALGADGVLLGRSVVYGLALDGESGVGRVLDLFRDELDNAMALTGRRSLSEVDGALLTKFIA